MREVVHLSGTPYERGLQHGTLLRSKVHSLYATLLTNSLLPYLSREQPDIALVMPRYTQERYQHGHFGYELLLDSAHSLERSMPKAVREELRGISDGSGLPYDDVLVLNTFFDSTLAVRGISFAIRLSRAPKVESLQFVGVETDGVDNDADGLVDEAGEGTFAPFAARPGGLLVEVPATTGLRAVLQDADGLDPATVRVLWGGTLYTQGSPGLTLTAQDGGVMEVVLSPPAPLSAAATQTLVLAAGDLKLLDAPPPTHATFMRDEEVAFTTRGAGLTPSEVRRTPLLDGRTRPPAWAVGLRGSATADGQPLLAQHFAMLDANTAHQHSVVLVHHPDVGEPYLTVGWAGIAYGLSGMNARGLAFACNPSDTLNNSVVGSIIDQLVDLSQATLTAKGLPIGFAGRKLLENAATVEEGRALLATLKHPFGWSCALADAQGGLLSAEVNSDVFAESSQGVVSFGAGDADDAGHRYASVGADDLEVGSLYAKNVDDMRRFAVAGQQVVPQREWSSFFYRGRRSVDGVAARVKAQLGVLDVARVQALLAEPELVDASDSMNAVVYEPATGKAHVAIGAEPATDALFEVVDLRDPPNLR